MPTFRDHFSASSPDYARFRPRYPRPLLEWIASETPAHDRVWDCGTGSGQAAVGLATVFRSVVATDASVSQLASAERHPRVRYVCSAAEASGLASRSVDAVTVAQAVHWFDMPAFFREAARVARPGSLVAVWTYWELLISADIDARIRAFYNGVVGPYWPPERKLIERQYQDVAMPFDPVTPPALAITVPMTLGDLSGYIGTWSATHRYREAQGTDPVPALIESLTPLWGDPAEPKSTTWPLAIRAGRISS
jgi:SAM-dependent methyltransferase